MGTEARRHSQQREKRLLNAWMWDQHREDLQWRNARLGQLPTKQLARMYLTTLRYADAIYIKDGVVYIVEAKLTPDVRAFGQLELYRKLFPATLEFTQFKNYPIKMVFLTMLPDINLMELASEKGIIYELYDIDQLNAALHEMQLPIIED